MVPISAAMVMPEMGLALTPISPVIRDETTTKKNPKMMMRMAPRTLTPTWGRIVSRNASPIEPAIVTQMGRSMSVRSRPTASPMLPLRSWNPERNAETMVGRAQERNDAGRGHGAGPDVEDEGRADLARAHVLDQLGLGEDRLVQPGTEQLDGRDQHQVRERAAGEQISRDTRPDDVPYPEQLG